METVLRAVLAALAYFASARLGYAFAIPGGTIALWPPSGVMLGLLLLSERRHWPALIGGAFAGSAASDLLSGSSPMIAAFAAIANGSETLLAAWVMTRALGPRPRLVNLRAVLVFVGGAVIAANAATAVLGMLVVSRGVASRLLPAWTVWWVGDGLGMLLVTPVVLGWNKAVRRVKAVKPLDILEAVVFLGLFTTTAVMVLGPQHGWPLHPGPYVIFPLLFWAALRYGLSAAATVTLILGAVAMWHAALGVGPFSTPDSSHLQVTVQAYVYLAMASLSSLIPAAMIRERRVADRHLFESEERFRQMAEHIDEAFFVVELPSFSPLYTSPTWATIWGRPIEQGRDPAIWVDSVHPDDQPALRKGREAVMRGESSTTTLRILRPDGTMRWVLSRTFPVRDDEGRVYRMVGVSSDVTEMRLVQEKFVHSQKMDAVGRLAGGIAHDFNNLLTVILSWNSVLGERLRGREEELEMVREIASAGERAAGLTRQLLAFSRNQVLAPRILDLNALVADSEKLLRRLIGEDFALRTVLDPGLRTIMADPGQVEQVIMNLVVNARDSMPDGGTVTIETANVETCDENAGDGARQRPAPYAMMSVVDSGAGMDAETKAHLFEPFFTTKGVGKGTGLGLSTVYGIVNQSGGFIRVDSSPGAGSRFSVYWPIVEEPVAIAESGSSPHAMLQGSETVLLVEDETQIRELTRRILGAQGYRVLVAENGEEALALAAGHEGPIDLLMTDVVMPEMSGRELAERLRKARSETRVLYVSGYTDDAIAHHGVLAAGVSLLQKPFTPGMLSARVRDVLDAPGH